MPPETVCSSHETMVKEIRECKDEIIAVRGLLEKEGGYRDRIKFLELSQQILLWIIRIVLGGTIAVYIGKFFRG